MTEGCRTSRCGATSGASSSGTSASGSPRCMIAIFVGMAIVPQLFFTEASTLSAANSPTPPLTPEQRSTGSAPTSWAATTTRGSSTARARPSGRDLVVGRHDDRAGARRSARAAGYYGGKTDMIISRFADIWFSRADAAGGDPGAHARSHGGGRPGHRARAGVLRLAGHDAARALDRDQRQASRLRARGQDDGIARPHDPSAPRAAERHRARARVRRLRGRRRRRRARRR